MANFKREFQGMDVPDLAVLGEQVRSLDGHPGWQAVLAALDSHRALQLTQLLDPSAKAERVDRLRGEILGLQGARDAAQQIVDLAVERETEAKRAIAAREAAHV